MTALAEQLFDRLDQWRHLPDYQLERRADIYFALHLPAVLERKFGFRLAQELVPEFPARIGTIDPESESNQSKKIDYLALTSDLSTCLLVELKTDDASRRSSQDDYLAAARDVGLRALLDGLVRIFDATNAKRKYYHLFCLLERLGLVTLPPAMHDRCQSASLRGISREIDQIEIMERSPEMRIVYVQPKADGPDAIGFAEFANHLADCDDPVTRRFCQSLREWGSATAGTAATHAPAICSQGERG